MMIKLKLLTRNLQLLKRNWSLKLLLEKSDSSKQDVKQVADANIHQLDLPEAEKVGAEAEEVDFTQMVVMEEMVVETVTVVETVVAMMITATMIPKMMMDVLPTHVVTTCVVLLLHRLHPHLPLTCVISPDLSLEEPTLRSFHHRIHLELFCQTSCINSTVATSLQEPLIIEKNL